MKKQVICVKWGTRYGPHFVNILYAMARRHITGPFRFICFTDKPDGIRPEVVVHPLPDLGCEIPPDVPGKWRKCAIWNPELYGETGPALFLDLDVVITSSLDPFFEFGDPEDVILARNTIRPFERLGQSSVFRFPIGKHAYMLEQLRADPAGISRKYQFEQRYTTRCIRGGIKFWPDRWVAHFRKDCLGWWVLRYFRTARLPRAARVVIFPGKPDPEDAILGRWRKESEHTSGWRHFFDFSCRKRGKKWRRHIHHYLLPVPWVAEHWRE